MIFEKEKGGEKSGDMEQKMGTKRETGKLEKRKKGRKARMGEWSQNGMRTKLNGEN